MSDPHELDAGSGEVSMHTPSGLPNVTAAILAGGLGTRLRAVVTDRPKPMAEVRGRPFLMYLLDQLIAAGLTNAVLCTGYRAEQVRNRLGERYGVMHLTYSQETQPLGTGGALRQALPFLTSDIVLVMNGDSICECDLGKFWIWHQQRQTALSLLLNRVGDISQYGQVKVDDTGRVTEFVEKNPNSGPGWVNAGVYLIAKNLIADLPAGCAVSLEYEVFPSLIGKGLYGYQADGRFLDIGTPETYQRANRFFE